MALKGLDGTVCENCGTQLTLNVQRSAAGWYLGYFCGCCGLSSRETGYYATNEKAEAVLNRYLADCIEPTKADG